MARGLLAGGWAIDGAGTARRAGVAALCLCGMLLACATAASARTVRIDAHARVGVINSTASDQRLAGSLHDARRGSGGLLLRVHPAGPGFAGALVIVDGRGSLQARLSVRARRRHGGELIDLRGSARVNAASGFYRGAKGTLSGSATLTADRGVGNMRLSGALHGVVGSAASPTPGVRNHGVDGRVHATSVRVDSHGRETIVGSVTGVTSGPSVVVLRVPRRAARLHSTFRLYTVAGTLRGRIDIRRSRGSSGVRTDTGAATVSGGTGRYLGARTPTPARVSGTRDLIRQLIALRIRGRVRW